MMTFRIKAILAIIFIIFCLWTGAFLTFMEEIEGISTPPSQKVGGIVVLTGTPARLTAGFNLLNKNQGARLLVSGVNSKVTRETLRQATGQSEKQMNCCVDLGRLARNTEGNAYETSLWVKSHNFDSLAIVTSAYHMPRSLVELKRQMPKVKLIAYPVASDTLELTGWWKNPRAFMVVAGEFNKYVFSLGRARLEE